MSNQILYVTDDSFEEEALNTDIPVLVDYRAAWCGHCKMLPPILEEIVGDYADKIKIAKLNYDENPNTHP